MKPMCLLDTDTLSNLLKRSPSARLIQKLAETPPDRQFTTAINIGEMVYGAFRSPNAEILLQRFQAKIDPEQVLPFDYEAAQIYGRLRSELEKKGAVVPEADLRIGSIALYHKLTVITGNVRHFSLIPNLPVENWM